MKNTVKKVVLAYSGGLDTSVILRWLQENYGCEVVTFTADIGQGEELEPARKKAELMGVKQIFVDDLREEFVRDFVFPMFRANALYEGQYLLGTSIARPLIAKRQIEIAEKTDANLLHISAEGKALEDPWAEPEEHVYSRTVAPEKAPDAPQYVEIEFAKGDPVAVDGKTLSPAALLTRLNELGGRHGIGRLDLVENRFVGMKSRGVYETPGGTILHLAHRGIESITLDRGEAHLKDELMPRYAELVYNGFWFAPERAMLQALIDKSQASVEGIVRLKLYKGSSRVVGRKSPKSLYSMAHVTFEADQVYDQRDAAGFIKLNALRLRLAKKLRR